jgi:hypothetical protein
VAKDLRNEQEIRHSQHSQVGRHGHTAYLQRLSDTYIQVSSCGILDFDQRISQLDRDPTTAAGSRPISHELYNGLGGWENATFLSSSGIW